MSYKTILVHLNDERRALRLLECAVSVAQQHEAHVIGLAVAPLPLVYAYSIDSGLGDLIDAQRRSYFDTNEDLEAMFRQATAGLARPAEWKTFETPDASVANSVIREAHAADLVFACQSDPRWYQSWAFEDPERLALETGRPVVLIPNAGPHRIDGGCAVVAWNGRPEAARAIFDALPLLRKAREVHVLSLTLEGAVEPEEPIGDMCSALTRHGVRCVAVQQKAREAEIGAEILRQAEARRADLLVMGAYGHSRVREFILGGASRHILHHMNLPVLMSH